ncbi:MAG: DUF485 domain-containing protein [Planctomycetales bacterium]
MQTRNARMGIILFAVYLVLYGGFVLINTFSPESINVAILYGFGLIIAAFIMALLYGFLCDSNDEPGSSTEDDK